METRPGHRGYAVVCWSLNMTITKSYYITDFDYTSQPGDLYPWTYNGDLEGKHPEAKANREKNFKHDWHALCKYYFPPH